MRAHQPVLGAGVGGGSGGTGFGGTGFGGTGFGGAGAGDGGAGCGAGCFGFGGAARATTGFAWGTGGEVFFSVACVSGARFTSSTAIGALASIRDSNRSGSPRTMFRNPAT